MSVQTKVSPMFHCISELHPADGEVCIAYNERYDEYAPCQYELDTYCFIHLDYCVPFDATHWRKVSRHEIGC